MKASLLFKINHWLLQGQRSVHMVLIGAITSLFQIPLGYILLGHYAWGLLFLVIQLGIVGFFAFTSNRQYIQNPELYSDVNNGSETQ